MWLFETNKFELKETIDKLDNKFSCDDQVCNILIKTSGSVTIPYFCVALSIIPFNLVLSPESVSLAIVIPIYKGTKTEGSNCRPKSLLNVFSKIYEKIINSRI